MQNDNLPKKVINSLIFTELRNIIDMKITEKSNSVTGSIFTILLFSVIVKRRKEG